MARQRQAFCESRSRISGRFHCQGSLAAKERSLHSGEAACVSRARGRRVCTLKRSVGHMVETATQYDLSGHAGTLICARPNKTSIASKQVLLAVWAAKLGIDCVSTARRRRSSPPTTAQRGLHRCGARRRKTAPRALCCPGSEDTVAAPRRPWARKRLTRMTSPRPST